MTVGVKISRARGEGESFASVSGVGYIDGIPLFRGARLAIEHFA